LALLGVGTARWLAGGAGAPGARATEFHQDFRSLDPNSPFLRPVALGGQPDDRGVRITLPGGQGKLPHSGFMTGFDIHGDFEATVSFEILNAERPDTGYGVGVSMYAAIDPKANDAVSLSRRLMPEGKAVYMADRLLPADGRVTHHVKTFPATAAAGKLRLRRVGSVVHYLVADGPDADFVQVDQQELGTADLRPLQVGGDAGGSQSALDARLLDLSIRAEDLPGLPAPVPAPASPPATGGKGWRSAAALLGLALALSVAVPLGVLLYVRRPRRAGKAPAEAPVPGGPLKPEAAPPAVSFPCPGCGKSLKARAELAGKKVKCPQCGLAVLVPEAGPGLPPT
jgi:predicted RNA-binding Zn-ribbon protein involved in translation (DUF1610 family)